MGHTTMSDTELKTAIRTLRDRAERARTRGEDAEADRIEQTIHEYQEQMSRRL